MHEFVAKDLHWMQLAIKESKKSLIKGEVPVGAILTINDSLVCASHNQPISLVDPTSHAEINVIRKAAQIIGNYRIPNSTLYVTLEPCTMCYGAIIHARIKKVVFGAFDNKTNFCMSEDGSSQKRIHNHSPNIVGGVLADECSKILKDFFKNKRP